MSETLVRTVKSLQPCDAVVAFEWGDDESAIVEASDIEGLVGAVLPLQRRRFETRDDHAVERAAVHRVVSSAVTAALTWSPAAAAAIYIPPTNGARALGLLLLWQHESAAPASVSAGRSDLAVLTSALLAGVCRAIDADLLTHVMRAVPEAIAFMSLDSHESLVNASAAALLGLEEGTVSWPVLAQHIRALSRRVVNRDAPNDLAAQLSGGAADDVYDLLWEFDHPTQEFWRVTMVEAMAGTHRGWLWTFRCVTREERALRAAQEQTREAERAHGFLRSMLDAMDDNVLACDADGVLFLMNAAARRRHGAVTSAMHDEPFATFVSRLQTPGHEPLDVRQTPLMRALRGEHVDDAEMQMRTQEDRLLDMSVSARPVHGEDGTLLGAVAVGRDITLRRAAEEAAYAAERLEALERMAVGVTHDLNNLMMVITAASASVAKEAGHSSSVQRDLALVDTAIGQARAMSSRLLDFCRGRPRLRSSVALRDVVRRAALRVGRTVAPHVEVRVDVPQERELHIAGTDAEVEQILVNLLENAAHAMPEGGDVRVILDDDVVREPRHAAYSTIPPGRYARLTVRDSGIGMHADTISRIFEPFFTTHAAAAGHGLGLATVLGTAHDLAGHVTVDSTVGVGSTFVVYLPVVEPGATAGRSDRQPGTPAQAPEPRSALPKRILLVDDDTAVRRAVSRMIERLGVTVVEVGDADAALATLAVPDGDIEAILSDVRMPGMSGIELFERARGLGFTGPVLLMTGYSDLDLPASFGAGGTVLTKPFSVAELEESFAACAM